MRCVSHERAIPLNVSLAQKPPLTENSAMRIDCPNCKAGYEVPERILADRARPLRCGQCRMVFAVPEAPAPVAEAPPSIAPEAAAPAPQAPSAAIAPMPAPEETLPDPLVAGAPLTEAANDAPSRGLRVAWAASIALLIGGGLAAIIKRDALMEAWPPAARLFGALGLG